ncbi:MAG TPA: hypothetical protein DDW76_10225 [Cyanobacteria bacterium UBA11369]|nr:hypothetical protein [Cyanobacteria bacterium UBA11371]HBE17876.1 hypothetical protein [Cyanobacteria bacterium UBA11367]HBE34652.1 hypothetical protein [Cyanobacteria bacterium UBA11368]HBE49149.1 hypothetical protein [Cyanobacteria bacterium UBA11369]
MEYKASGIPISAQFAEILTNDIADFVYSLEQLNSPETNQIILEGRQAMEDDRVIQTLGEALGLGSMVAVDGGNNILDIGSGSQCFIIAVRYSLRNGYDPHFMMDRFKFESAEPSGFMYGIRNAMEIQQIREADEKESFCIVDNSWVSLLQTVNRTIFHFVNASSEQDREITEKFLEPLLAENGDFVCTLKNPRNIAISKSGISSYYCERYTNHKLNLADKVFLLGVLRAGEYTEPKALVDSGIGQLNVRSDKIFVTKDEVKDIYNTTLQSTSEDCLCLTYFRPHEWSPVKRIEFHKKLLKDNKKLFKSMLQTVADSMIIPTIHEPLEQFLVDEIVKRHTGKLPNIYQTVGIANIKDFSSQFAMQLTRRLRT